MWTLFVPLAIAAGLIDFGEPRAISGVAEFGARSERIRTSMTRIAHRALKDDPLPIERTNCVRCHLTAGRELTVPVRDFARSVHDRARMSCNDCHGGNTDEDSMAHEQESGFIGTKLSAHMKACAECHTEEAETFRKGPHFWDLTKRINRDFPVCIDCHGNHDVGKPPADFSLTNVCSDCHKNLDTAYPDVASIIAENDRLWQTLRQVHAKNRDDSNPTPAQFRSELGRIRYATARLIHSLDGVQKQQAESINARVRRLRTELDTWLKEAP
jgi:Cytochrome c3